MPPASIVVIGGSAGALDPLRELVAHFPHDFPAAVLVVVHVSPDFPSHLPGILARSGPLPARHARHGDVLQPGHILVAPPDHHLLVGQDRVKLSRGPKENRSRPSIDVLFRSAAYTHRHGVIGVLLSGMLDDGTSGLWTIKQLGGRAVVQHPEDAAYSDMPLNALREVNVDAMVPAASIALAVQRLLHAPLASQKEVSSMNDDWKRLELEVGIASGDNPFEAGLLQYGSPSTFTCPECHGVMVGLKEGNLLRFRCHTGHAYSPSSLLGELRGSIEASVWNAVRALDEKTMLLDHLAKHTEEADQLDVAAAYREEARETRERARRLRQDALRAGQLGHDRLLNVSHGHTDEHE
ncbi:chemotaxis protein CheB [Deinococcus yavapaiensis]|uniref:protein-glutamate methylesterase n=1 Tax=Deinococcus yavapaiensis KR-236 TaxID=694435 RepID=A0A318S6J6_9DEIO|nr:chemotaxis protein CheB [Deinococcus yavapaiensis]PYE50010.1 two-component system chemotaxis response regulator CheB [Deinococcus yavapaiensis KR-236]